MTLEERIAYKTLVVVDLTTKAAELKFGTMFRYQRAVPAPYAAAIQLGDHEQATRGRLNARRWLRAKYARDHSWTEEDRAVLGLL